MTDEQMAAVRAREAAATPGPWQWKEWEGALLLTVGGDMHKIVGIEDYTGSKQEDRDFAKHARTDIPALLAHIDALAAENAKLRDENNDWRALFLHILNTGSWNMLDEGDFDGEFTPNDLLFLMGGTPGDDVDAQEHG